VTWWQKTIQGIPGTQWI